MAYTLELCDVCEYASEHGHWPQSHLGTHCRECHRSWTGLNEMHCVVCHLHFSNVQACDMHKNGVECLDPETIVDALGRLKLTHSIKKRQHPGVVWTRADHRGQPLSRPESSGWVEIPAVQES